ncbi:MAG TPA: ABC transporter ATP-binding protein [Candidatus Krumholzibacteria bacterium]|nr:ABC transporter ATP-binding protein [Candidatus Krumholzibacteria bacterium]
MSAARPLRAEPEPLLSVEDLRTCFETEAGTSQVLAGVNLRLGRGEVLGLVGESGSGKTMTALSILGLVPEPGRIVSGEVRFDGQDLRRLDREALRQVRGRGIAMVFQEPQSTLNPVRTCGDQIGELLREHLRMGRAASRAQTLELLRSVHLPDPERVARQYPHELSGGMCRRVAVALALSCQPQLLIADEATSGLDRTIQAQILALLAELQAAHDLAVLHITHDLAVVAETAARVAVMYAGRIVETGPTSKVFAAPAHPYTRALLRARPGLLLAPRRLEPIPGVAPDPRNLPSHCPFQARCPFRVERCLQQDPEPRWLGPEHWSRCFVDLPGAVG